jgi:hypothetical protein
VHFVGCTIILQGTVQKHIKYFKAKNATLMAFNSKVCMEHGRKNPSLQVMTCVDLRM